jgi:hypothetical protein
MWRPAVTLAARQAARVGRRHITATATQIISCGCPHNRDYLHLYHGDREALTQSLDRIQSAATIILTAVSGGG